MNLSTIRKLVAEGDLSKSAIRYLLECGGECEWLDHKQELHLDHDVDLGKLTRDVLALKNVGGGYLVIGAKDKTWEPIGLLNRLPLDTKMLRGAVRRASGLDVEVDLVHHELDTRSGPRLFALILVRRSRRRRPVIVAQDFAPKESWGLRKGDILARSGDSTVRIQSQQELEDLLDDLEALADAQANAEDSAESSFAVEDGTYRLLEKGFEHFVGREPLRQELLNAILKDPRIWITNVHGPGGVGKSALVNWATYQWYSDRTFESIIQLTAKETILTSSGIQKAPGRSLYSLENLLDLILETFQEEPGTDFDRKRTLAIEILDAWSTLLVLDNMETVSDGRILHFVQTLPPSTRARVLMTSRTKTGGWELSVPVGELNEEEVAEFLSTKSREMNVHLPVDRETLRAFAKASGGLPLALQWMVGQYKLAPNLRAVLDRVNQRQSPILEFSFGNVWSALSSDARSQLALLTIFDSPPTVQQITVACEWPQDRILKALTELSEVTLVTANRRSLEAAPVFVALPITLAFARHKMAEMGEFELVCRRRFQRFNSQLELQASETRQFLGVFDRFGLQTDTEKRAAILCRRGESERFAGREQAAEALFQQARDLAPSNAYVLAMSASYYLARNQIGMALSYANQACTVATKKTGGLCFRIRAEVAFAQRDRKGRVDALRRAVEFEPKDNVTLHQYGVALSLDDKPAEAVVVFSKIIDVERQIKPARPTLLMALKTRIINLRRLGRREEASEDLALAVKVIADNPHLKDHAFQIRELEGM